MSTDTPSGPAPEQPAPPRPRRLERSRFGGSGRRPERHDDDAPVSRSDPGKCPQELLEHREARIDWRVLWTASAVILAFPVWAILLSGEARLSMKAMVDWIAWNLGWYYVLTVTLVIGFVLWVALSKEGSVRQGPPRQSVFHAHIHVGPRYAGDGFSWNLPPGFDHKPDRDQLDVVAARIATALEANDPPAP